VFFRRRRPQEDKKKPVTLEKKVPIITLDNSWHQLFEEIKTPEIESLEEKLNELLKEQGKLNTDYIEYTRLKKDMLDKILELTHQAFELNSEEAIEEIEKQQKMVLKINEKTETIELRLDQLTVEIETTNKALVDESVQICYTHINKDREKSNQLDRQIQLIRETLMKKTEEKKALDKRSRQIYRYLHQLVGPRFIEELDKVHLNDKDWEKEE